MTALLSLQAVSKSFGGVRALRGVTLDLQPGEVHALVGENGAGKSTLVRIVTGAHAADAGTVAIGGQVIAHADPLLMRGLGVASIYQQPALFRRPCWPMSGRRWMSRHRRDRCGWRSSSSSRSPARSARRRASS